MFSLFFDALLPRLPSVLLAILVGAIATRYLLEARLKSRARNIPNGQISALPVVGDTPAFVTNPDTYMRQQHGRHGPIFRTTILGKCAVFLSGPEAFSTFEKLDRTHAEAGWGTALKNLWGRSAIINLNGEKHKRVRRLILGYSCPSALPQLLKLARERFTRELDVWTAPGRVGPVEAHEQLSQAVWDVAAEIMWGPDMPSNVHAELFSLFNVYAAGTMAVPINVRFSTYGKSMAAKASIEKILMAELDARMLRQEKGDIDGERTDMLHKLIVDHKAGILSVDELRDNARLILWASMDTTSTTSTIVTHFALTHPDVLKKVHAETLEVLGKDGWATTEPISVNIHNELPYTAAAVKEAMRLNIPTSYSMRQVVKDIPMTIQGTDFIIPAGTTLVNSISAASDDKAYFEKASEVEPARFLPPRNEDKGKSSAFVPFGIGARACPGQRLAKFQLIMWLSMLSERSVHINNVGDVKFARLMFPVPVDGLWIAKGPSKVVTPID